MSATHSDSPASEAERGQLDAPLVTIMIPTYGQASILNRAIESALAQTYPNLEVVVADDASPDDTAVVVGSYSGDPRLRYVRRHVNLGRTRNYRATLVDEARGEFALNLDGDDWLCDKEYVADAMALVRADPDLVMVFARSTTYLQKTDTFREQPLLHGLSERCDGTELFLRYPESSVRIPHMTALYRRDLAVELGFYEHDVVGSDSVALLLLLPGRQVGFIDRVVGVWRYHESNATWSSDLASRRANFAVADIPARSAAATRELDAATLRAWRHRMSVRLGHQGMADSIVHGRLLSAALFAVVMLLDRPAAALGAIGRLAKRGGSRLMGSARD